MRALPAHIVEQLERRHQEDLMRIRTLSVTRRAAPRASQRATQHQTPLFNRVVVLCVLATTVVVALALLLGGPTP